QGAKRIAVFHQEDAYGKTGLDVARIYAKQPNLEIVAVASAPYSATDLGAQATRLREAKVDAVLMQSSIPAIGSAFLKAAKSVGLPAPIYANSGLAQKAFVDSAGSVAEGLRILSYGNIVYEPTPSEKKLVEILHAKGMKPTGWGELVGADALMAAVSAARQI